MNRKDFLKWFGLGGIGLLGSASIPALIARLRRAPVDQSGPICSGLESGDPTAAMGSGFALGDDGMGNGTGLLRRTGNAYGSMVHPPSGLHRNYLSSFERPLKEEQGQWLFAGASIHGTSTNIDDRYLPPFSRAKSGLREIEIHSINRPVNVAHGTSFNAWTFNGRIPGPVIRATAGETLRIRLRNLTDEAHSVHFHGSHDPNQDGWEPIPGGTDTLYTIRAGPVGVHPYHCHVPPLALHMAKGLFGTMIVDPPGGRPPAHEVVLILSGYDLQNRGRNDIYCWNGIAGFYDRFPIRVNVGELVRVYLVNMLEYEPVASFHLHAQTFDVFRSGTKLQPDDHTDVITLGQTERAILEFRLPYRGRYMFHPHQIHMAERGAMGWFVAI